MKIDLVLAIGTDKKDDNAARRERARAPWDLESDGELGDDGEQDVAGGGVGIELRHRRRERHHADLGRRVLGYSRINCTLSLTISPRAYLLRHRRRERETTLTWGVGL